MNHSHWYKYTDLAAWSSLFIAFLALLGWWLNHDVLAHWLPAIANMTFNTAFCFGLLAIACLLGNALSAWRNKLALVLTVLVLGMVSLSLLQDILSLNLGVDQILFNSSQFDTTSPFPGRMSSITSLGFLLAGLCFVGLLQAEHGRGISLLIHSSILLVILLGLLGVGMNVLMGDAPLYFSHLASISLLTAINFLLLASALLGYFQKYHGTDGHPLLYAGIHLMFSLKYPQKFALISVVFAIPLVVLMSNELNLLEQDVDTTKSKIIGIQHIHTIVDLLDEIPAHRGMTHAHLENPKLFIIELKHTAEKIDQLMLINKQFSIKHNNDLKDLKAIKSRWQLIKAGNLKSLQAWRLHSEMIVLLRKQMRGMGRETQLSYDTDPMVHNLVSAQLDVLPQLFEHLGQLRGQGSKIIATGHVDIGSSLMFSSILSQTGLLLMEHQQLHDSAWGLNQQAPLLLLQANKNFVENSHVFLKLAESELIQQKAFSVSSKAYFNQASKALNAGSLLSHASLDYVQTLLQKRIEYSVNKQYLIKFSVLLVAVLMLYLFSAFYQSVMHTIRVFAAAVESIREGKTKEIDLFPARDEMMRAFNSVAKELVHTDTQMSAVIDYAVDGIITTAEDGTIQSLNPAAEHLFAYHFSELEGKDIRALIPEAYQQRYLEELYSYMEEAENEVLCSAIEIQVLKKDQTEFPISLSVSSVVINHQRLFIAMLRDVSRNYELEQELRQAQKMQSVGVLVGGVAHNFNNMLAGIVGQNYLAQMECQGNTKAIQHLKEVEHITEQASDMVKQLLTYAHKDFFRHKQDASLSALIQESFAMAKLGVPESIQLKLHISDAVMSIHCDIGQIQQVLINMINNARDAVEHNDEKIITVSLQPYQADQDFYVRHPQLHDGNFACLEVVDNGHGMSGEVIERIFDPFFTSKDVGSGTGLGLSTAFGSISSHGGVIEVDSSPELGSHFSVYLPLLEKAKPALAKVQESISHSQHGETILLVDDEDVVLDATHKVLLKLGYQVITAKDGLQGFECFMQHQDDIDAIISDVIMPHMGGLDMCRKIRKLNPDILAILMTGYDQGGVALEVGEEAITTVLSKPVPIAILSQQVQALFVDGGLDHEFN